MYYQSETENSSYSLTDEAKHKTYEIKVGITGRQIEDIIITALEGGIDHWAVLDNAAPVWENKPKGMPVSQYTVQLLLEGKSVELYEDEDVTERWELSLPKLLSGIELCIKETGFSADLSDIDADIADTIVQLALFGELVYS